MVGGMLAVKAARRIVSNTGMDRVIDIVQPLLRAGHRIDIASRTLSLYAFGEFAERLTRMADARLVLPPNDADLDLLGSAADRAARNRLQGRWLLRRWHSMDREGGRGASGHWSRPTRSIVLRKGDGRAGASTSRLILVQYRWPGLAPGTRSI